MSHHLTHFYTDFQGLSRLKARARSDAPEPLREVAQQFEALFLQRVLDSMRQASLGQGLMDGPQAELYQDMYDKQLAIELARGKGLGLADSLVCYLGGGAGQPPGDTPAGGGLRSLDTLPRYAGQAFTPPSSNPVLQPPNPAPASLETPTQFVQTLLPHACQAAAKLGMRPEVLLAQAALETGWGKGVPRGADGRSSHNLFGIKADSRWQGAQVAVPTLEYRDGVAVKSREAFRAYASYEQSFADYVAFLKTNPRYESALQQASDPAGFLAALQQAGYATDPNYAEKVQRVLDSNALRAALIGS